MEAFLEAGRCMGIRTVDYNAPDGFGFGYVQTNTNNGHRASSAKAFLHPHKRRSNLHILTRARVTKVLINPETKRAYAVRYTRNGKKYTVRCRREIILSAGTMASPQLLMLSGVGSRDHLQSFGIPVIKDLPVGKTLYDHIAFPTPVFKLNTTNVSLNLNRVVTVPNLIKWLQYGEGLLSSIGTVEALGYIKTSQSEDPELVPDVELVSLAGSISIDNGTILRSSWRITEETYNIGFSPLNGFDTWTAVPLLLKPRSKGHLELRNTNPYSYPKLYSNYLSDPRDMATLIEAIRFIIKLGESEPFKKYGAQLYLAEYEQCRSEIPGSDAYWDCAIRTMVITFHHQISTCRMGPPNDPYAVVDPELRVYGINGLRVVDTSVIPRPTSAHTNAPAMMIGEKAADMIKFTWS